ncbi:hypothetical protein H6794_02870 [Candidatus Nomurabacteria bacterium]|jgi:hypothetical protein|nr:hypothetical protein [Candidatus Saccharibacteria bacterium]MCB9839774.1 hypothetical protein [Candidatus Nomurabacteria bacterium]
MGHLISITASSRKQAEKTLSELTGALKKQGKKVSKVRVAINLAPEGTKNPYIASTFDINARYAHLSSLEQKLKNNDFVFLLGSAAETAVRESSKFKTKDEFVNYLKWLEQTESNSYGLPVTNIDLIIGTDKNMGLKQYAEATSKSIVIKKNTSLKKIALKLGETTKPTSVILRQHPKLNMYDVVLLASTGKNYKYKLAEPKYCKNPKIKELLAGNNLVAKQAGLSSYFTSITTPLSAQVVDLETTPLKVPKMHSKSVLKFVSTVFPEDSNELGVEKISSTPKNEVELASSLLKIYGHSKVELTLTKRMRLFEAWLLGANYERQLILKSFDFNYSGYLTFYDILYLTSKFKMIITWNEPNVYDGFVDCSAPEKIDSLVQELFDTATSLAGAEPGSAEKYLLLGHKVYVYLKFDWQVLIKIYKNKLVGGSELVKEFLDSLSNYFEEKYPIVTEIINSQD